MVDDLVLLRVVFAVNHDDTDRAVARGSRDQADICRPRTVLLVHLGHVVVRGQEAGDVGAGGVVVGGVSAVHDGRAGGDDERESAENAAGPGRVVAVVAEVGDECADEEEAGEDERNDGCGHEYTLLGGLKEHG